MARNGDVVGAGCSTPPEICKSLRSIDWVKKAYRRKNYSGDRPESAGALAGMFEDPAG